MAASMASKSAALCDHRHPLSVGFHLRQWTPPTRRRHLFIKSMATKVQKASELQSKFGSDGIRFMEVGGMTVLEVKVNTGTNIRVLLKEARVTSYKYKMWHGGLEELLQTDVSDVVAETTDSEAVKSRFLISGGMFPSFSVSDETISEENWQLESIKQELDNYVQITLGFNTQTEDGSKVYLQDIITLSNTILSSAVLMINKGKKPFTFTGSISSHLSVRSTESVSSVGLHGCSYYSPSQAAKNGIRKNEDESLFGKLKKFVWQSQPREKISEYEDTTENEQKIDFKGKFDGNSLMDDQTNWFTEKDAIVIPLSKGIRKLYPSPPKGIRISDEGFRRSVVIDRHGFENFEIYSPQVDGENPFVVIGCGSVIPPVLLKPKEVWRAAQVLIPD